MPDHALLQSPGPAVAGAAREEFTSLADGLQAELTGDEVLFCGIRGENSDFVRLNRGEVRQAGSVLQRTFGLHLIHGQRHAKATVSLSGEVSVDRERLGAALTGLRERLPVLPEDPYLHYATKPHSTTRHAENELLDPGVAMERIRAAAGDRDLVGVYASGAVFAGLQSSLGQANWYDTRNFNFDWSLYHAADKAVKTAYAGFQWDDGAFQRKMDLAGRQLEALKRPPRTIRPGRYRVYLSPAAVDDVLGLLAWGGFGLKAIKTRQSPLLRLARGEASLHPSVRLLENTAEGIAPDFQEEGFLRPAAVALVESGRMAQPLVSPRSAKEYGTPTNGASAMEAPESLDMAGGDLAQDEVLRGLDTGIWIGNVWYLNYSDRAACRTTGMTRFATFWVEKGEIVAPLNVMRFDETVYNMLGENLVGLTSEREFVLSPGTYSQREVSSGRYPGALVEDFRFTL